MTVMFNPSSNKEAVMKTWIKRTLIGALSATVLAGGLAACGSRGEHRPGGGWSEERITEMRGKAIEKVSEKLELNEAQKQKLGVLADEMLAQRKAIRGDTANPRAEMQALIAGDKFDRSRAQTLLEQKTQAVQAGGPRVIAAMADFYDSLTPAQQAQVREKMEKRGGWWKRG
jgi:Spy/CpxP family protein refolding chaperone